MGQECSQEGEYGVKNQYIPKYVFFVICKMFSLDKLVKHFKN